MFQHMSLPYILYKTLRDSSTVDLNLFQEETLSTNYQMNLEQHILQNVKQQQVKLSRHHTVSLPQSQRPIGNNVKLLLIILEIKQHSVIKVTEWFLENALQMN